MKPLPNAKSARQRKRRKDKNGPAFPVNSRAVINVTAAPYYADPTGRKDSTAILIKVLDDVLGPSRRSIKKLIHKLERDPRKDIRLPESFENRKENGQVMAIFPEAGPPGTIIYFPAGTYLVSDTVCYSFDDLINSQGMELNWCIRMRGDGPDRSMIKLKDRCPGFEKGMNRPVVSYIRGSGSNVAMSNYFEDLGIDTGKGNPGAVGLEFFGNNCGAVRNVRITSPDRDHRGSAGISVSREMASCCLFKNISVNGFDHGLRLTSLRTNAVLEHIVLTNQNAAGIMVTGMEISVRNLQSRNRVPAVHIAGPAAHVVILNCILEGIARHGPAIDLEAGHLYARHVTCAGHACSVGSQHPALSTQPIHEGPVIREFAWPRNPGRTGRSLRLAVREPAPGRTADWVSVRRFGARGNGRADDTAALQAAFNSGCPDIFFEPGRYPINAPLTVSPRVHRINFMFCDLKSGPDLAAMSNRGLLTVTGDIREQLTIEDLFARESLHGRFFLVDHAGTRPLFLSDIHCQSCAMYRNSVPGGSVFIENVMATTGINSDRYSHPNFMFRGQQVWARQLNAEYAKREVVNEGSRLWVMGFKTEGPTSSFVTRRGGATEILGGILNIGNGGHIPAVVNDDSAVSITAATNGYRPGQVFRVPVRETGQGKTRRISSADLPRRFADQYVIPLYSGRRKKP